MFKSNLGGEAEFRAKRARRYVTFGPLIKAWLLIQSKVSKENRHHHHHHHDKVEESKSHTAVCLIDKLIMIIEILLTDYNS